VVEDLTTRHGFQPNIQVYTTLIQACLNNRKLDRAMQVHDRMAADPACRPDEKAYSVLVRGCLQANGIDEGLRALRAAYRLDQNGKGRVPGVEVEILADAMARLRSGSVAHREAASLLVSELKAKHGLDVETMIAGATRSSKSYFRAGAPARRGHEGHDRRTRCA